MRLRTALVLGVLVLIGALLVGTVAAVTLVLSRAARRNVGDELAHHREAFGAEVRADAALLRSETRVVAEEPRLKAVVASEEVSRETVAGVVFELRRALPNRLFVLLDGDGRLVVDATDPGGHGLVGSAPVARALADGDAEGAWTFGGQAFELAAHRLSFGTTAVGVLVLGKPIDDGAASAFLTQTGSDLAVLLDGKVVAASPKADRGELARALAAAPADGATFEATVGGVRYLVEGAPFPASTWGGELRYAVMRSLDAAMAPARHLVRVLYALLLVAMVLAWPLVAVFARRLSRPVDALVAFTRDVGAGKLETRATPGGTREVQQLGDAMNRMVGELAELREREASRQRLERELEIATRIQTSILPRAVSVPRLEIAAEMVPATQVGGDYYDVLPVAVERGGGCWIGIGDVSGHGLPAGLIMLMVQSVVAGLVEHAPDSAPSAALDVLNRVLWSNIRQRLTQDDHVTLSLMRYHERTGEFVFAGAHEEIVVWRAGRRQVELVETPGTWIGGMRDVAPFTVDSRLRLETGDVMVLYTDGVTEAMNRKREQFGIERLSATVERVAGEGAGAIRDAILADVRGFMSEQRDDITVVVMRRT